MEMFQAIGSILGRKWMCPREKLDESGAIFEKSPRKSLVLLAQQPATSVKMSKTYSIYIHTRPPWFTISDGDHEVRLGL